MTPLVTIEAVQRQLRVGSEVAYDELAELASAATALILNYIAGGNADADAYKWTEATAPADVKKAILVVCMNLYDMQPGVDVLSPTVKEMVLRHRIWGAA